MLFLLDWIELTNIMYIFLRAEINLQNDVTKVKMRENENKSVSDLGEKQFPTLKILLLTLCDSLKWN